MNGYPRKVRAAQWRHVIAKSDLSGTTKGVAQALACFMDKYGYAFVGMRKVASASGFDKDTVRVHVHILTETGFLEVTSRGNGRANGSQAMCPYPELLAKPYGQPARLQAPPYEEDGRLQAPEEKDNRTASQANRTASQANRTASQANRTERPYIPNRPIDTYGDESFDEEASKHFELKSKGLSYADIAKQLAGIGQQMPGNDRAQ